MAAGVAGDHVGAGAQVKLACKANRKPATEEAKRRPREAPGWEEK
jgi:hypothetical protein